LLNINEPLEQAYRDCMFGNYFTSDPQKRGKFSFKYLRYVNVFLSDKQIEILFKNCRTVDEIHQVVTSIKTFVDSKLVRQFTAENFQDLIKIHYNSVNTELLHEFCQICQCRPQTILIHLIPAIRRTVELKIIHHDFVFEKVIDDFQKLNILLNFVKLSFNEYLSSWFKIQQPWEAQDNLHTTVAQKNIRIIYKNLENLK
jgi:hypothetical protein